ncbi:MAG: hypothetical protein NPINA01_18950 [Nitrospinaceae bacterium]|nr:MAG: hypothetical protein NPINA01_18950 [Nitrospinaceae bacterium]
MGSGEYGVIVKANDIPLADLIQEIQNQSGIEFKVTLEMKNEPFSVNLEASSWTEAVLEIIEDFNHLQVWDKHKRLTEIHLLSLTDPEGSLDSLQGKFSEAQKQGNANPAPGAEVGEIFLNETQLARIGMSPYRSPISPKLLDDPQIRMFLEKYGIKASEDLKNSNKAMKVRKVARRQLQELRKRRGEKRGPR